MPNTNSLRSARTFYVTRIAMLTAVASLLMIIELPIPIFPSFYKLDFSYFPVVIATFSMGPVAGTVTAVLKNLIAFTGEPQAFLRKAQAWARLQIC